MPVLFRNVRPDWTDGPPSSVAAVFTDADNRVWISWPCHDDVDGSHSAAAADPLEILGNLDQLEHRLREFAPLSMCDCPRHDNNVVHLKAHEESWFTVYGWNALLHPDANDLVLAALIPIPPLLVPVVRVMEELQRRGVDLASFTRTVDTQLLLQNCKQPDPVSFPGGSQFLGFPRQYLNLTVVGSYWQHVGDEEGGTTIPDLGQTTGSAAFHQIVERLGIIVLGKVSKIARHEISHLSGASFQVTVARARGNSSLPSYSDGTPRRQWKTGSALVFKRPAFDQSSDASAGTLNLAPAGQHGRLERYTRVVVNELWILSHKRLRRHRNIIHLFGICWDKVNIDQTYDACPILVQAGADLGNLTIYLEHMSSKGTLSWSLRIDILRQILTGLRDLHALRIVHGDIKCLNILVGSLRGESRPRVMLSDFGASVSSPPGKDQVEIQGGTRRYASPEVFRRLVGKDYTMPLTEALASDIYSFGLTACAIIFNGRDAFEAALGVRDALSAQEISLSDLISDPDDRMRVATLSAQNASEEEFWQHSKTDEATHSLFVALIYLTSSIARLTNPQDDESERSDKSEKSDSEEPESIGAWICGTLGWSPSDRQTNISDMLQELDRFAESPMEGEISETSTSRGQNLPFDERESSIHNLVVERYCLFYIDGALQEIAVTEVPLESSMKRIFTEGFEIKQQILNDFKAKASPLMDSSTSTWTSLRLGLGLQKWARSAYAAYQVFLCYLSGFGTRLDLVLAAKYLAVSSRAGYTNALSMSVRFYQKHPELLPPDWNVDVEALSEVVSLGPFPGFKTFALDAKVLRELAPDRLLAALDRARLSAFSELGEDHFNLRDHEEESFRGPDVEYQWFARGSMALFQRLLPKCSPPQLLSGFRTGLFPRDERNYNDETALYMCCRIGAADGVRLLVKELEWFGQQAAVATRDGRLPLHCLHYFKPEHVEDMSAILLAYGADINAVDSFGRTAIDDAIISGREDVAFHLLTQRKEALFEVPALRHIDIVTAAKAALSGSQKLFDQYLGLADIDAKLGILLALSSNGIERRIVEATFANLPYLLQSLGKLSDYQFTQMKDLLMLAMSAAIQHGNSDILAGVIEHVLPKGGISGDDMLQLLISGASRSHLPDIQAILTIPVNWTVDLGHRALMAVVSLAGPSQLEIAKELLVSLDGVALARDCVNHIGSDCASDCKLQHLHSFSPSPFDSAVIEGHYGVAELMAPYVDHTLGRPTALFHILQSPGPGDRVLYHIDFLAELGPENMRYICYPLYDRTVLQVVAMRNDLYESPMVLADVIEALVQRIVSEDEEDIDYVDRNGSTALIYAADYSSPTAVQSLIKAGADPLRTVKVKPFMNLENGRVGLQQAFGQLTNPQTTTPYEFCLFQLLMDHINGLGLYNPPPTGRVNVNAALPFVKTHRDIQSSQMLLKFRTLAELSSKAGKVSETPARYILPGYLSNAAVKGLVPGTNSVQARIQFGEGQTYCEIWGEYLLLDHKVGVHIARRDELTPSDEAFIRARLAHQPVVDLFGVAGPSPAIADFRFATDDDYAYQLQIERAGAVPGGAREAVGAEASGSGGSTQLRHEGAGAGDSQPYRDGSKDKGKEPEADETAGGGNAVRSHGMNEAERNDSMRVMYRMMEALGLSVDVNEETPAADGISNAIQQVDELLEGDDSDGV